MIKLVFGQKNKIIKHDNRDFFSLRQLIKTNFPQAPVDYSLSYIDQDKDQICLNSDQDLKNMFNVKLKVYKVYIKQSLSQTIVVDLDRSNQIEVSFDSSISPKEQVQREEKIIEHCFLKQEIKTEKQQRVEFQTVVNLEKEENKQIEKNQQNQVSVKEEQIKKQLISDAVALEKTQIVQIPVKRDEDVVKAVKLQIPIEARVVSKLEQIKKEQQKEQKKEVQVKKLFEKLEQIRCGKKQEQALHLHGVICNNCKDQFGILGIRYQCILCHHYNLCSKCQAEVEHKHALLKIKTPKHAISQDALIQKYKKQIYQPVQQKIIPPGHYVPSINKEDAMRIIQYAKQVYDNGYNRAKQSIQELFTKLSKSHENPYQVMKPINQKRQSPAQIANYLGDLMGIPYNEAFRFVNKHPNQNKQRIVQFYLSSKK